MPPQHPGLSAAVLAFVITYVPWVTALCVAIASFLLVVEILHWQVHRIAKALLTLVTGVMATLICHRVLTLEPLIIAKLGLIIWLAFGTLLCVFCMTQIGRWHRALDNIQQECEMAAHLTFLQAEMTRAQLENLNQRLSSAVQPREREIAATMLKSLSPFVMLYLKKEKSIFEWSMAAVNIGRGVLRYILLPKKS